MSSTYEVSPNGDVQVGADAIEASRVNGTKVYNTEGDSLSLIHI